MVAFNLGYLPGGDRDIRTTAETTLAAFSAAAAATMVNGVVFLTCYVGHEGGSREYEVLMTHLRALDPREWNVVVHEVRVAQPCVWPNPNPEDQAAEPACCAGCGLDASDLHTRRKTLANLTYLISATRLAPLLPQGPR
jgi:hypothetical protein